MTRPANPDRSSRESPDRPNDRRAANAAAAATAPATAAHRQTSTPALRETPQERRQRHDSALHAASRGKAPVPNGYERRIVTAAGLRAGDWLSPTGRRVTTTPYAGATTPSGKVEVWLVRHTAKRGWFIQHKRFNARTKIAVLRRSA